MVMVGMVAWLTCSNQRMVLGRRLQRLVLGSRRVTVQWIAVHCVVVTPRGLSSTPREIGQRK